MSKIRLEVDENDCCTLYVNDVRQDNVFKLDFHAEYKNIKVDYEQLDKENTSFDDNVIVSIHKVIKIGE